MRTTVFDYEGSQAAIIPEEFRFDAEHLDIGREGESLIITPFPDNNGWPKNLIESVLENPAEETFIRHPQGEHREIIW
jgi:virulence-associated protein VagC